MDCVRGSINFPNMQGWESEFTRPNETVLGNTNIENSSTGDVFVVFCICMVYYFLGTDDNGISNASRECWVKELHLLQDHHTMKFPLAEALTVDGKVVSRHWWVAVNLY